MEGEGYGGRRGSESGLIKFIELIFMIIKFDDECSGVGLGGRGSQGVVVRVKVKVWGLPEGSF